MQFFAYNLSGKHFTPTSCGVIRNQRSKIRRSNMSATAGCPFRKISKFECRVIKHARIFILGEVLYYGYSSIISYVLFVKKLIKKMSKWKMRGHDGYRDVQV